VVELTMALHLVFESPRDALIFDTGHQAYPHKLLTGREDDFDHLRASGGLSGYPSRAESEHDWVESSHASAALSYADGLAKAFELTGSKDRLAVPKVHNTPTNRRGQHRRMPPECTGRLTGRSTLSASRPRE